jgi:hypothetical protein
MARPTGCLTHAEPRDISSFAPSHLVRHHVPAATVGLRLGPAFESGDCVPRPAGPRDRRVRRPMLAVAHPMSANVRTIAPCVLLSGRCTSRPSMLLLSTGPAEAQAVMLLPGTARPPRHSTARRCRPLFLQIGASANRFCRAVAPCRRGVLLDGGAAAGRSPLSPRAFSRFAPW